ENRGHFVAIAATAMRRALVDHARRRAAQKRGAGGERVILDDALAVFDDNGVDLLDMNEALEGLAARDDRQRQFLELYYFGGLGIEEIAMLVGLSAERVRQVLREGEAWLRARLSNKPVQHGG